MLKTFPLFLTADIFRTLLLPAAFTLLLAPLAARAENIAPQWVRLGAYNRQNTPPTGQFVDTPPAGLAVDGSGNITVAGTTFNFLNLTHDFHTARYAGSDGAVLWERSYNGSGNAGDVSKAMALDASGNVFVTGSSVGSRGFADLYTAKYAAADGALLWEKRDSGASAGDSLPKALAVDPAGNVIVTGSVKGPGNNSDFYTAKYAAADGALLWQRSYTGLGNGEDDPVAVAVDTLGNVVVTGYSADPTSISPDGQTSDFYTAKYAGANGALIWERRFSGTYLSSSGIVNGSDVPAAMALAPNGDVVVTGSTTTAQARGPDFYTARYAAANGALLWERYYDGPQDPTFLISNDFPFAVAVDSGGNVVVTGTTNPGSSAGSIVTLKYAASNGAPVWQRLVAATVGNGIGGSAFRSLIFDASDNVILTGTILTGFLGDFYTAKYAAGNGAVLLEKRYNPLASVNEEASKIASTPDGGLIVFGRTGDNNDNNLTTVKYLPTATTEPPVLTSPATGSAFANTIAITYALPDAATNGSVKLTFAGATTTVLTLANTQSTYGLHSLSLPSANLNALGYVTALSGPAALADGIYTVTLSYRDTLGDPVASTTNLNVRIDRVAPALTAVTIASNGSNPAYAKVNGVITVTFTANEAIQAPTATIQGSAATITNVGGNTWQATRTVPGGVAQETTTFAISIKDLAGNVLAAVTATTDGSSVTVDRVAPTLTLLGANPQTVEGGAVYVDPGATASDATAGNLNGAIQVTGALNMNVVGTYLRTYAVADFAGNTAAKIRTVRVVDTTPAVITILGDNPVTVEAGLAYHDAGATAQDAVAGNLTASIQTVNLVNTNVVGDYQFKYTVSDGLRSTTAIRTVKVRDTVAPVITILGNNPATVEAGTIYNDGGATASDTFKGNLTAAIQTASNVNANVIGGYAVSYTVSDGVNTASVTRTVRVIGVPIAGADTLGTVENNPINAAAAKLLANDTDPNGLPLSVTGVSPASSQGGTVVLAGGLLTYTPPSGFTGSDSFTYTITNGFGSPAIGIVRVTVSRADGSSLNVVSLTRTLDGFLVQFTGIPGEAYLIQFTDSLAPPVTWQTLTPPGPIQAGPNGLFQLEDKPDPIPPQRFYRAAIPQ